MTAGQWTVIIWIFLLGAAVGSFLNVCIYRLPRALSIYSPSRSFCPLCKAPILWYDNIPVASWLALGRRCRNCRAPISWRYPLVELVTAVLFAATFAKLYYVDKGQIGPAIIALLVVALLIVGSVTDFDFRIIPEEITLFGTLTGLLAGALVPELHVGTMPWHTFRSLTGTPWLDGLIGSAIGMAVGGGLIWVTGAAAHLALGKEAMGFGDVLLMGMVGSYLGWKVSLVAFFLAPFMGIIYGVPMMFATGDHSMPYGPWLAAATWVSLMMRGTLTQYVNQYAQIITEGFRWLTGR